MRCLEIEIEGRVQGVNFRAATCQKALSLGLYGEVWNTLIGTVIVRVEGKEQEVDLLLFWLQKGPIMAKVEKVKSKAIGFVGYKSFEISYPKGRD